MTIAALLEAYTFSEILEMNDLTEEDALEYLAEHGVIKLPEIVPLTLWLRRNTPTTVQNGCN